MTRPAMIAAKHGVGVYHLAAYRKEFVWCASRMASVSFDSVYFLMGSASHVSAYLIGERGIGAHKSAVVDIGRFTN